MRLDVYKQLKEWEDEDRTLNAGTISSRLDVSKATAYRYIHAYQVIKSSIKTPDKTLKSDKRLVSAQEFEKFMFDVIDKKGYVKDILKVRGFKSTKHLFCLFVWVFFKPSKRYDSFEAFEKTDDVYKGYIDKRTFNRYFKQFRDENKKVLKKRKINISRSHKIPNKPHSQHF